APFGGDDPGDARRARLGQRPPALPARPCRERGGAGGGKPRPPHRRLNRPHIAMAGRIAVFVKGYPRLSETFIAQEIRGLEQRGLKLVIVSLRHPTDPDVHPVHREIAAPVLYLPEYLEDDRPRVRRAWARVRGRPGYREAWELFRADFARDRTDNRIRRFGQAMVAAAELPPDIGLFYVHYLHTPASVGRYAARILGLPWAV